MNGPTTWTTLALLTLTACGGGMGSANLRVTDQSVKDCRTGTCVEATCVVTNIGIADGEARVKVDWKGPATEGVDTEEVRLRAGESIDITRTFDRSSKATRAQVGIACEIL